MGGRTARTLTVFATASDGHYAQRSAGFGNEVANSQRDDPVTDRDDLFRTRPYRPDLNTVVLARSSSKKSRADRGRDQRRYADSHERRGRAAALGLPRADRPDSRSRRSAGFVCGVRDGNLRRWRAQKYRTDCCPRMCRSSASRCRASTSAALRAGLVLERSRCPSGSGPIRDRCNGDARGSGVMDHRRHRFLEAGLTTPSVFSASTRGPLARSPIARWVRA